MVSLQPSWFPLRLKQDLPAQILTALVLLQIVRWLYKRRFNRMVISYIPGPPKTDWLFGNLPDLTQKEVGVSHLSWQKKYGSAFRIYGLFGEQYLMTSDPKAVQYIQSNTNSFGSQAQFREFFKIVMGPGILVATGDDHKRQRRVMQPAFGMSQLKDLFPVFSRHSDKVVSVIKKDIDAGINREKTTINVFEYLARASLDIIGDAAFDYQFGALDDKKDGLREVFNRTGMSLRNTSKLQMFFQFAIEWIPPRLIVLIPYLPAKRFNNLRTASKRLHTIADRLVKDKIDAYEKGLEGGKDLMSLLVRANARQEQKAKLSDVEVRSEIASITAAGQGTTASTMAFALWELAKDLDLQHRIRQEIRQTSQRVQEQGRTGIQFDDYEGMSLLVAFIKEVLRWHPVVANGAKQALEDSIIPLSNPVTLESGRVINEIPISKGQKIWINISGYNRLPEIFGHDSYEFNINRWLNDANNETRTQGAGVYAGLMTFAHGPKACIGWRFSLLEIQMLLINMISNFEFTLLEDGARVLRSPSVMMIPTMEGDNTSLGPTLLLDVSIL